MRKAMSRLLAVVLSAVMVFSAAALFVACGDEQSNTPTLPTQTVPPDTAEFTVTLNGEQSKVKEGGTFTLPETFTPEDSDFEFVSWKITGEHTLNGNVVTVNGNLTITAETRRKDAEKVKDGISLTFIVGEEARAIAVSDYIVTHGNTVTVNSSAPDVATVALNGDIVTVTVIAEGTATITVSCGEVEITFAVTAGDEQSVSPSVKSEVVEISETHDLYFGDYTVNLAENIEHASLIKSYTVNSEAVDGTSYAISGDDYTQTPTLVTLNVTATYDGGALEYVYKVNIIDSTEYRLTNGGFDNGLDGWTKIGEIGNISSATAYWTNENDGNGYPFNADGKFFSAYEPADNYEKNIGALVSSEFKIAQNRIITFKLGGAKHDIFVDVVSVTDGEIIARYGNSEWAEYTNDVKSGCTLIAYKATLPESAAGKTAYIRILDEAASDYGVLFCDSFVTYYNSEPDGGFIEAVDITDRPATIYDICNGGFEQDMKGWRVSGGDIGAVTSDKGYWNGGNSDDTTNAYGQEGEKLFSWWSWNSEANDGNGAEYSREGNMGTLTSSMFVLKAGKYVSFKFGGGENRNVYIELVNIESGSIIAVFRNENVNGGGLISYNYKVDELSADTLCCFRVVDNAVSGWGCFTADDFRVNLDSAPEGSAAVANRVSEYKTVVNGSFESGNLDGWFIAGDLGAVTNAEKAESWYQTNESTKDRDYLFTFHHHNGTEYVNKEGGTGIIRSSAFILEKNGIISFRFGAAHNREVYINVYTAGGVLLAQFRNNAYTQDTVMVHYYYAFDNAEEISCYFEVVDNAVNDYGCIVMDDFRVNLDSVPSGAVLGSDKTKAELDSAE